MQEPVICPECGKGMEFVANDQVQCLTNGCKVSLLPRAQIGATVARNQLAKEGKLRRQQTVGSGGTGGLEAAMIASSKGPKPWG